MTLTFDLLTSKWGHGSPVSWASFLSIFSLLCPSVIDWGSGTVETDGQTRTINALCPNPIRGEHNNNKASAAAVKNQLIARRSLAAAGRQTLSPRRQTALIADNRRRPKTGVHQRCRKMSVWTWFSRQGQVAVRPASSQRRMQCFDCSQINYSGWWALESVFYTCTHKWLSHVAEMQSWS